MSKRLRTLVGPLFWSAGATPLGAAQAAPKARRPLQATFIASVPGAAQKKERRA